MISTESGSKTLEEEDWSADMRGPASGGRREWARSSSTHRERGKTRGSAWRLVGRASRPEGEEARGGVLGCGLVIPGRFSLFFFFSFLVSKPIINIFKSI